MKNSEISSSQQQTPSKPTEPVKNQVIVTQKNLIDKLLGTHTSVSLDANGLPVDNRTMVQRFKDEASDILVAFKLLNFLNSPAATEFPEVGAALASANDLLNNGN